VYLHPLFVFILIFPYILQYIVLDPFDSTVFHCPHEHTIKFWTYDIIARICTSGSTPREIIRTTSTGPCRKEHVLLRIELGLFNSSLFLYSIFYKQMTHNISDLLLLLTCSLRSYFTAYYRHPSK
jgi:hypothetical protein